MKNKLLQIGLVSSVVMLMALPVFAATLSLSPANVNAKAGQKFNAVITLDPQGVKNYTVKVELKYPANLLEVKSFTFASNWMPLSQTGYDLVDNAGGTLIKTAGYPGGLTSPATFGTVSFVAKTSGSGSVTVGSNTQVFDASNGNVLSGALGKIAVTIKVATTLTTTPSPTPTVSPSLMISPSPAISPGPEGQAVSQGGLFAAIGSVITLGTGNAWLGILVVLILIVVVYYLVKAIFRRPKGGMPA